MSREIISVRNISKSYGTKTNRREIFKNVSLDIFPGERVCIVGANGSGKSTFLKLLLNQINVDSGSVQALIDGDDIVYLPQDYRNALFPWLSIRSNLAIYLNSHVDEIKLRLETDKVKEIERVFDDLKYKVDLNKYPYQLSGGEQQTLLLAQAILRSPKLFIADEPFSAIDFHKKDFLEIYFSNWIQSNNITSIIVSHDIEQAAFLSNKIITLTKTSNEIKNIIHFDSPFPRNQNLIHEKEFLSIIKRIKENFE